MTTSSTLPDLESLSASDLEALVAHHNKLYWDLNAPVLSDYEYDRLVTRLKSVAPSSPALVAMGPSTRLGAEIRHSEAMLSLDKCYSAEELKDWVDSFEGDVVAMPKIDGVACTLHYDANGNLKQAATRGDGVVGDDITQNALQIADIPRKLPLNRAVEVRGEVFMKLSVFQRFKAEGMANPRNLAAGAINQKDAKKSAGYGLSFFGYELLGAGHETQAAQLAHLKELKFAPMDHAVLPKERAMEGYDQFSATRATLDYEIDGVVYKTNRVAEQKRLGKTAHHPRYALAFKFQGDSGTSTLRQVEWSVARTGAVTPVAIVDPVALSGVTVTRASLHHPGFITKLGLTLGAQVIMMRRGGVIPNVESVVAPGTQPVVIPSACPECGAPTRWDKDFLFCSAPTTCKAALVGRLSHFAAVVDLLGFGDSILDQAYVAGIIRTPADFFTVTAAQLCSLEKVGEKVSQKLVAEVARKKTMDMATFLRALGVHELGKHVSKLLATRFSSLDAVLALTEAELSQMHSVGETIARSVVQGLKDVAPLVAELRKQVTIAEPVVDAQAKGTAFNGQTFVFTGKMAKLDRKDAEATVASLGGAALDSVNKALTYLVVGDQKTADKSTKQKAAEKHIAAGASIKVISESDFLVMVDAARATTPVTPEKTPEPAPAPPPKRDDVKIPSDQRFAGTRFYFTGNFQRFKPREAVQRVETLGGKVVGSTDEGPTHVVMGVKARGAPQVVHVTGSALVIDEAAFVELAGMGQLALFG